MSLKEKKVLLEMSSIRVIEFDDMNVKLQVLGHRRGSDDLVWKDKGYFHSVVKALECALDKDYIIEGGDIVGYIRELKNLKNSIKYILGETK